MKNWSIFYCFKRFGFLLTSGFLTFCAGTAAFSSPELLSDSLRRSESLLSLAKLQFYRALASLGVLNHSARSRGTSLRLRVGESQGLVRFGAI